MTRAQLAVRSAVRFVFGLVATSSAYLLVHLIPQLPWILFR